MKVAYKAIDPHGLAVTDVLEAPGLPQAHEMLRRDGYLVTDLHEAGQLAAARVWHRRGAAALSRKQLLFFTRQMAMLLKAGSPIVPALGAIARQLRPGARAVLERLRSEMEQGVALAEAMKNFPETFSDTYVAIVAAGEQSANLPAMFTRLSEMITYRHRLRSRLLSALAYPCMLMVLSGVILLAMILFVVPRFAVLFETLDGAMPWSTRQMLAASQLLRGHWPEALGLAALAAVGAVLALRSRWGRQKLCDLQTRLPGGGRLGARLIQAQIFRVMGLLLESRVTLMDMLRLGRQVTSNGDFQGLCDAIQRSVEQGQRFSEAILRCRFISPSIAQAIWTGEEAGHLDQALLFVSDVLDDENGQMLSTATKLLEPAILIGMGLMVGGIAMSLFVPLFDLAATSG
jgi:type II secretory pathway component PulF